MSTIVDETAPEAPAVPKKLHAYSCRQARRHLAWTHVELAGKAGVRVQILKDFERLDEITETDCTALHEALRKGGLERLRELAAMLGCEYPEIAPETNRKNVDVQRLTRLTAAIAATINRELAGQ